MRLTFITGCLEPGRDGVGDYTRLLATECAHRGIPTQLVAFADRYVSRSVSDEWAPAVRVTRLSSEETFAARMGSAVSALAAFNPSWISVQFVPYSYGSRGVPLAFARALPRLIGCARLHVMFHETWIWPNGSWRRWLVSAGQRHAALSIARRPGAVVHTSNTCYQEMFAAHGVDARILRLFGSIPVSATTGTANQPNAGASWLEQALRKAGCEDPDRRKDHWWLFVLFGTLHPVWPPEPLLARLREACSASGRRIAVVSVGHIGSDEALWQELNVRYGQDICFVRLGEQPAARIAEVFQVADFGIATTPYFLLGKSATVAAMFDHGLPVIVNRDDGPACGKRDVDERRSGLTLRMSDVSAARLQTVERRPPAWQLQCCVDEWLAALERHNNNESNHRRTS